MIPYQEFEKSIYAWFLDLNDQDNSFCFSTRVKATTGAERNYFIGTERSGYFMTTFWDIPISYPGNAGDLIDVHFSQTENGFQSYLLFRQTKSPVDNQNRLALDFILKIKETLLAQKYSLAFEGKNNTKYENFDVWLCQEEPDFERFKKETKSGLGKLISLINKELKGFKLANPEFQAKLIDKDSFKIYKEKLERRLKKYPEPNSNTETAETNPDSNFYHLNQILFGPPGTGKTYHTINRALEILEPETDWASKDRAELRKKFDSYQKGGRLAFCTFHQSMSYEDFVEGIKPIEPSKEGDPVIYKIVDGIFKKMVSKSVAVSSTTFESSYSQFITDLGKAEEGIKIEMKNEVIGISLHPNGIDLNLESISNINTIYKKGLQYVSDSGIFVGTWGNYYKVIFKILVEKYGYEVKKQEPNLPHVLIIDEINRGNVSQIFGELITLIEEDKRAGKPEALEVILTYSKEPFSVPANLFIIGTMNTADRSVEALDTALRRRFVFEEMPPKPELLSVENSIVRFWNQDPQGRYTKKEWDDFEWEDPAFIAISGPFYDLFGIDGKELERPFDNKYDWASIKKEDGYYYYSMKELLKSKIKIEGGINLQALLETINSRIEVLLSKDHQIGHSYFMKVYSEEDLKTAFYKSIIPLLQEYFYGDYGKIGLVLGSGFVKRKFKEKEVKLLQFDDSYEFSDLEDRVVYEIVDYRNEESKGNFLEAIKAIY